MARRPTTQLKDAVVLAYLRGLLDSESGVHVRATCPEIRDALNSDQPRTLSHPAVLMNNEEVYNSLLRLEADGEVKRTVVNSRVVGWEAARPDSLLVREPVRTIKRS